MKPIILFPKELWNKKEIQDYLQEVLQDNKVKLRYAFSHIIATFNDEIDYSLLNPDKKCFFVIYDFQSKSASPSAIVLEKERQEIVTVSDLLDSQNGLAFDILNFGFFPFGGSDSNDVYQAFEASCMKLEPKLVQAIACGDLIECERVPDRTKKLLLDYFTIHGAGLVTLIKLHDVEDLLLNYSQLFLISFSTRALFEKLMLLIASEDDDIDFNKLEGGKSMKGKFISLASKSNLDLTKRLSNYIHDLALLDDYYRTPEVHKTGRLLGLIYSGNRSSLLNEVVAFFNESNHFFGDACKFLREKYQIS